MFRVMCFLALVLTGCSGCAAELESTEESGIDAVAEEHPWATWETCGHKPGDNPCNFELKNQHGDSIELYDYYNQVIVIDISAMWCGVCANIAPKGDEFTADYGDERFEWLTLMIEDSTGNAPDQSDLTTWVTAYGVTGHVLAGDRSMIDPNAETGYPVSAWPTVAVIDSEMTLYNGLVGWNETTVRSWVETLLED